MQIVMFIFAIIFIIIFGGSSVLYLLGGGIIISIIYGVMSNKKKSDKRSENCAKLEERFERLNDFNSSRRFIEQGRVWGLSVDEARGKICVIRSQSLRVYCGKDIISSEIIEDGATVTKHDRGSQLGGAVVGALLLGGVGAVVGGLSG